MSRPSFHDLTPAEQRVFGNGVGPDWLPEPVRGFITGAMSWFFSDASWRHHDFGYSLGYTEAHRWLYDWKFLRAMLRDALTQTGPLRAVAVPAAILIALGFYVAVAALGWIRSFRYADRYSTLEEILNDYDRPAGWKAR